MIMYSSSMVLVAIATMAIKNGKLSSLVENNQNQSFIKILKADRL